MGDVSFAGDVEFDGNVTLHEPGSFILDPYTDDDYGASIDGAADWSQGGFYLESGYPVLYFAPGELGVDGRVASGWGYVGSGAVGGKMITYLITPIHARLIGSSYVDNSSATYLGLADYHAGRYGADSVVLSLHEGVSYTGSGGYLAVTASKRLFMGADSNTYLQWVGADHWVIVAGGVKVLDITPSGISLFCDGNLHQLGLSPDADTEGHHYIVADQSSAELVGAVAATATITGALTSA